MRFSLVYRRTAQRFCLPDANFGHRSAAARNFCPLIAAIAGPRSVSVIPVRVSPQGCQTGMIRRFGATDVDGITGCPTATRLVSQRWRQNVSLSE